MTSMILNYNTLHQNKNIILSYMKNQSNIVRFLYNRIQQNKNLSQKQLRKLANSMNNIFVDSHFKNSAIYKTLELKDKQKVIFGGKKLFFERLKNKINKQSFKIKKLFPIYMVGRRNRYGNSKFDFKNIISNNKIIFKPIKNIKIQLQLSKLRNNYKKILYKLQELCQQKKIPVTVSLDLQNIYLTYDQIKLQQETINKVKNRIMSIDMNPNYIGYSIIDWKDEDTKDILKTGIISIKKLNDQQFELKKDKIRSIDPKMKYLNNKRSFQVFQISKMLVNLARSHNVERFAIEQIKIKSSDRQKGSKFNRLINNLWCRNKFVSNLQKRLNILGIKLYKIYPRYSSFIGNLLNNEYSDRIAASIEINRRCYHFKNKLYKSVMFPDFKRSNNVIRQSLEELNGDVKLLDDSKSWKQLYGRIKKSGLKYRIPLQGRNRSYRVLSLFDKKSLIQEIVYVR